MDLLTVDIGPYYVELIGETQASKKEDMVMFVELTMSPLVLNMAESLNERQIHVFNKIMTPELTRMHDDLLESLAVLQMNRELFQYQRDIFQYALKNLDPGFMDDLSVM